MRPRQRIIFPVLIFFLLFWAVPGGISASPEEGDTWEFDVQGSAGIKEGNLAQARVDAIQDALRRAVTQAVTEVLSEAEAKKATHSLKDFIYSAAERYVQAYKITSESPGPSTYKVTVSATVATEAILHDLGKLGLPWRQDTETPPATVTVTVRGIQSFADYVRVRELLKGKLKGVLRVQPRLVHWGRVEFSVSLKGTVQSLAMDLRATGQFTLEKIDAEQGRIEGTISGERVR